MRTLPAAGLVLLIAGCGDNPPAGQQAQQAQQPAAAPAVIAPAAPSAVPDQGTVTKTLGGATVTSPDSSQGSVPGDEAITAAIRKAMQADATLVAQAQDVHVSTSNGTVTVRGTVASGAQRSRIEMLARDAAGSGAKIDDQLMVAPRP